MAYRNSVKPGAGESLYSITHRLSDANHFGSFRWISSDIGLQRGRTVFTPENIARLAELSRLDPELLEGRQAAYIEGNQYQVRICGDVFPVDMVEIKCSRMCTECFRETGRHQLHWQIKSISHCHIHGTPLTHLCPTCGNNKLLWSRRRLARCSKGHSIFSRPLSPEPGVSTADLAGIRAIVAMIPDLTTSHTDSDTQPAHLPKMGLCDTIMLLTLAGQIASYDRDRRKRPSRYEDTSNDGVPLLTHGLRLAQNWPIRFRDYLLRNRHARRLFDSDKELWLARRLYQPDFLSDQAIKTMIVETAKVLGVKSFGMDYSRHVTISMLVRKTGHSRPYLIKLLKAQGCDLTTAIGAEYLDEIIVDADLTREWEAPRKLATLLKVDRDLVEALIRHGAFGDSVKHRLAKSGAHIKVSAVEFHRFIQKLRHSVRPADTPEDAICWGALVSSDGTRPVLAGIILAALDGVISPLSFEETFDTLAFRKAELSALLGPNVLD